LLGAGKAAGGVDSVEWVARTPLSCRLDVRCAKNSILMLSNAWYPSWRCAIDGAESPVLKADGGLQAVALRAGRHGVEFHFDAGLFQAALAAALAGLLVLAGIGLFELRRSRRP